MRETTEPTPGTCSLFQRRYRMVFRCLKKSRPLCLVLDFESEKQNVRQAHRYLPQHSLNALHALLAQVPAKGKLRLQHYATVIAVVAMLLEPARKSVGAAGSIQSAPERVSDLFKANIGIAAVARAIGYHRDHLSRKLKRETGLGLRAHRDRLRLELAEQALSASNSVATAAANAGFDDANYFARWFKRKTGMTPRSWDRTS